MPTVILGAATLVPILAILLLRSDAALVFLSLCAGFVLTEFMGENSVLVVSTVNQNVKDSYVLLAVLLAPAILMLFALRKSISKSKQIFNIMPAIAVGLGGIILAHPLLPEALQKQLSAGHLWPSISSAKDLIMGGGVIVSFIAVWLLHRSPKAGGHNTKKKHH